MILNNTTTAPISWVINNSTDQLSGTKGPESWGSVNAPAGPFNYTVIMGGITVNNVNNPDACLTYTGAAILVTYPGA